MFTFRWKLVLGEAFLMAGIVLVMLMAIILG